MNPNQDRDGWCVEFCVEAEGDSLNGLDLDSVKYQTQFFDRVAVAQNYARFIACSEPCPCIMGEIGIHNATYAKHGKLTRHWRIDDERHTEWVDVPAKAVRMTV